MRPTPGGAGREQSLINFSAISPNTWLGRSLRAPLRLVPKEMEVPILQGPMRGKRWVAGSSDMGCWLGTAELSKVRRVERLVQPGMTCYDIGANVGYYTLLTSVLVGASGKVFAFEPVPGNIAFLRRNLRINRCGNVQVFELALTDFDGVTRFAEHRFRSRGHLDAAGNLEVRCASLDSLSAEGAISAPNILKIDVEGAELKVLRGARQILEAAKPVIFLATHGPDVHASCCRFLGEVGYGLEHLDGESVESSSELLAVA
jgi:FkbM family methyltransferase